MNESFKTDPSLAISARAAKESGSYLCASNVTPTAVRFIVSVFLCLLCSCRMSSTQMTCSHFRKNRPKKRQKPAGCRSRIISKNRPVPIFGRSTGASLWKTDVNFFKSVPIKKQTYLHLRWPYLQQMFVCWWTILLIKWVEIKRESGTEKTGDATKWIQSGKSEIVYDLWAT